MQVSVKARWVFCNEEQGQENCNWNVMDVKSGRRAGPRVAAVPGITAEFYSFKHKCHTGQRVANGSHFFHRGNPSQEMPQKVIDQQPGVVCFCAWRCFVHLSWLSEQALSCPRVSLDYYLVFFCDTLWLSDAFLFFFFFFFWGRKQWGVARRKEKRIIYSRLHHLKFA